MSNSQLSLKAILFCLASSVSIVASAQVAGPVDASKVTSPFFNCSMNFHASGRSIYIGIGFTELSGDGVLNCYDVRTHVTQKIPLNIRARGPGAGLGVTGINISGGATGIGVAERPERLLGHYLMVRGNAAVGVGAAVGSGLRLSNGAATINVSVESQTGLGAGVDLLWIDVIAVDGPKEIRAPEQVAIREEAKLPIVAADEWPVPQAINASIATNAVTATTANVVPTTIIELAPNQPIQILDQNGKVLQLIYVKAK